MSDSSQQTKIVEVAAAVLQRPDGSFLLAQRPADKIWAGYWEFPGGKIEPGETPYHALVRELREELGIEVETAYPWVTRIFTYPHATVRLNFFRVTQWSGELHPHEGQEFAWQLLTPIPNRNTANSHLPFQGEGWDRDGVIALPHNLAPIPTLTLPLKGRGQVSVSPMLPANAPILRALELPSLYAISNVAELGAEEFMHRLEGALCNGLRLVQLREKNLSRAEMRALSLCAIELAHAHGAQVLINSDVELAQEVGADGIHFTSTQLAALRERPALPWCAASCHNKEELHRAEERGMDFAVLGPVLPTQSHPGAASLGWEAFGKIAAGSSIPVYALGGLCRDDFETAWQHGAHGIALLRQAW